MTLTASPKTSDAVDHAVFADLADTTADTWFTTTDHRRVGRLMVGAVLLVGAAAFAVQGLASQKIDAVLAGRLGDGSWLGSNSERALSFSRLFSAQGMALVMLVAGPLFLALATIAVPRQIGSARLAFPRLQAFVLWGYVVASALYIGAFVIGDGPPAIDIFDAAPPTAAVAANRATDLLLAALMLLAVVMIAGSANIVTTVLTQRRPGLVIDAVRPFTWASFVTAGITLISAPVFLTGLFLLYIDQHFAGGLFSGNGGPRVWTHMVWLYGRPDALLLLLPALGMVVEIVSARAKEPLLGGNLAKHLLTAFGVLTLAAWTGGGELLSAVVQPTSRWQTGLVAIPAGLLVLVLLGSLAKGAKPDATLVFAAGFVIVAGLCVVNVVVAAIAGIDRAEGQAAWQIGQTSTLLVGAVVLALAGGIVEFAPMAYGRKLLQGPAALAGLALLGGVLLHGLAVAALGYQSSFVEAHDALSIVAFNPVAALRI